MRLLVLRASGGCGRWVTRFAVRDGHDVTALVRQSTVFAADRTFPDDYVACDGGCNPPARKKEPDTIYRARHDLRSAHT